MKGVVAAGHPLTAEAGARVLREGGNAVDAAVAACLMSFVCESPLTGPGAGGFMLVHTAGGESVLLDFFVAAPGLGSAALGFDDAEGAGSPAELVPIGVEFSAEAVQVFNVGASSCGVPGTLAGLAEALARFGSAPLGELAAPAASAAREGIALRPMQAHLHRILAPILSSVPEGAEIYEPQGRPLRAGELLRLPELTDLLERVGAEGPRFVYDGDVADALSDWVLERGGLLTREDLAAYRVLDRVPARVEYGGREVLTNPPPSSGGILIAYSLALLARLDRPGDERALVEVMERANAARTEDFVAGLQAEGYMERFLAHEELDSVADEAAVRLEGPARSTRFGAGGPAGPRPSAASGPAGGGLGSTTHVAVLDSGGACASVTCSNGSGSGVVVPGTGIHLNNMLGEQDLNPFGFHRHPAGVRIPSMMAPTVVLRNGAPEVGLGSAGSNRIRSAVLQTLLGVVDFGLPAEEAVGRARLHLEDGMVDAEPGIDPDALAELEHEGYAVRRWGERNLYFGGVQAVARDPESGELSGGGDPRRGGVAVLVE
jgi:gamma-glutamyltranspeptidase / glutathione hydrolase